MTDYSCRQTHKTETIGSCWMLDLIKPPTAFFVSGGERLASLTFSRWISLGLRFNQVRCEKYINQKKTMKFARSLNVLIYALTYKILGRQNLHISVWTTSPAVCVLYLYPTVMLDVHTTPFFTLKLFKDKS